jgi:hypothetical protein
MGLTGNACGAVPVCARDRVVTAIAVRRAKAERRWSGVQRFMD